MIDKVLGTEKNIEMAKRKVNSLNEVYAKHGFDHPNLVTLDLAVDKAKFQKIAKKNAQSSTLVLCSEAGSLLTSIKRSAPRCSQ